MKLEFDAGSLWLKTESGKATRVPILRLLALLSILLVCLFSTLLLELGRSNFLSSMLKTPLNFEAVKVATGNTATRFKNLLVSKPVSKQDSIPEINLFVSDNTMLSLLRAKAQGNPELGRDPGGDKPFYPGRILRDGKIQECKVGLRGANYWHHAPEKPSLRIKVKKGQQSGRRFLELSRPEDALALINWLPEQFGEQLGLMTPQSKAVRLFLNGKSMGLYLDSYRSGEPLAIANGRLPGTFFKGDDLGGSKPLWNSPEVWGISGEGTPGDIEFFHRAIAIVSNLNRTPEQVEAFFQHFDFEKMARWSAVLCLSSSAHVGDQHNQTFFLNSYLGRLEPVVWDVNGFGPHLPAEADPDLMINLWQALAFSDARFLHRRNEVLWDMITETASPESLDKFLQEHFDKIEPTLSQDTNLMSLKRFLDESDPSVPEQIANNLILYNRSSDSLEQELDEFRRYYAKRVAYLKSTFRDAKYQIQAGPEGCLISVYGRIGVGVRSRSGKLRFRQQTHSFQSEMVLHPGRRYGEQQAYSRHPINVARPANFFYPLENELEDLEFFHPHTKEALNPDTGPVPEAGTTMHPFLFFPRKPETIVLGPAPVTLDKDLIIEEHQTLEIKPGTEVSLEPGVKIVCLGKASIKGTKDQTIRLTAATQEAWGSLAFVGQERLEIEWVEISGGGPSRFQGHQFKGMLSAYQIQDMELRNCTIGRNRSGDDAVNIANSSVRVVDCKFENALSDALDLDQCSGLVSQCRFTDSGNDGLDLSTSQVRVTSSLFSGCGDKGLSAGEASVLELEKLDFSDCEIALQAKDASRVQLSESRIENCRIALSAYRKKPHFEIGGQLFYRDLQFEGNIKRLDKRDKHSKISEKMDALTP